MLQLDEEIAELVGIIFGDGNIWSNGRWYEVTITGNGETDQLYFSYIADLVRRKLGSEPYVRVRGGLRLTIKSKEFYHFLTRELGIPSGEAKAMASIPPKITKAQVLLKRFIRGIFDTDGSVFTSDKNGSPRYPCIEITNMNSKLITCVCEFLKASGYRARLRCSRGVYKIALNGRKMVSMWNMDIGASNPNKASKLAEILNTVA